MTKEELIAFLKENLKVNLEDDGRFLKIEISLGDEIITSTREIISMR